MPYYIGNIVACPVIVVVQSCPLISCSSPATINATLFCLYNSGNREESILKTLPITIPLMPSNFALNLRGIIDDISGLLLILGSPMYPLSPLPNVRFSKSTRAVFK